MNKKKYCKYIFSIVFIIWVILTFFGIFTFIPEAEYHIQEAIMSSDLSGIEYIILIDLTSKGAFIAGKKINVEVEITKENGKRFLNGSNQILIGSIGDSYKYPVTKSELGLYRGGFIELTINDNGDKLIGSDTIYFDRPGEYPVIGKLFFVNENGQQNHKHFGKNIRISNRESWLSVEQNNRIFSLTLIVLALTFISLFRQGRSN